ncbi:MAG: hypothetical protein IH878_16845 [Gemmatimonadetes bacterium]|nr:hypothetical protein [Gemmatimonadota bacterium]
MTRLLVLAREGDDRFLYIVARGTGSGQGEGEGRGERGEGSTTHRRLYLFDVPLAAGEVLRLGVGDQRGLEACGASAYDSEDCFRLDCPLVNCP